jgi:hypothetical protein
MDAAHALHIEGSGSALGAGEAVDPHAASQLGYVVVDGQNPRPPG